MGEPESGGGRAGPTDALSTPSSVELDRVSKYFGEVAALRDVSLDARPGEFLVLLGPSGCGKSTVLRLVAGLERPTEGVIRIGDRVVNTVVTKDRDVAMVFQSYALYPHLTVRKNIEFPLRSHHMHKDEIRPLVEEVAESLQIGKLLSRKPAELSGGQRQRAALARALVRRPKVFLMDEPLSNLDAQLRVEMRAELVDLHTRLGVTILYVTHDQVEAMTMGQRIAILKDGELQQLAAPRVVHDEPANAFVAGFIGSPPMNILRATLRNEGDALVAQIPGGTVSLAPSDTALVRAHDLSEVVVGIRPEEVAIDPAGPITGTVSIVEATGRELRISCRLANDQLMTVECAPGAAAPTSGEVVRLRATGPLHLFDPATEQRLNL